MYLCVHRVYQDASTYLPYGGDVKPEKAFEIIEEYKAKVAAVRTTQVTRLTFAWAPSHATPCGHPCHTDVTTWNHPSGTIYQSMLLVPGWLAPAHQNQFIHQLRRKTKSIERER